MGVGVTTFEVKVEIRSDKPIRWHSWKDGAEYLKIRKMFHIERRTQEQAIQAAEKHGNVISCRKLGAATMIEREANYYESLPLDNALYVNLNPYKSAVAMDELIWNKRNIRRKNSHKDKNPIDKT